MKIFVKSRDINISLHILVWSTLLFLPYFVSTADHDYKIGAIPGLFFTISGIIHAAIFYSNAYYLYPKFWNKRFWWLYILSIILLIITSFQLKYHIMATWFPEVQKDVTNYKFVFAPSIGILIISLVYRKVIDKINSEKEQKEKHAEQLRTELKFLRSQISPHFLFNVLTNLVSLARKKSDHLESALIKLSDLIRYMLYDTQGEKVLLSKEVTYLSSYIELQKLRFGNDVLINYNISSDDETDHYTIEPMLLIPFVENAFKHGLGGIKQPLIDIQLSVNKNRLVFEVWNQSDHEEPDTAKDESSGIGLANVRSRLDLLYRGSHTLNVSDHDNVFHITLTLLLT
ncbi:Histidine kinase [Chitinophaga sp. CF118]|uniref:sensor histidine kinase n=1 Tax=Chitinophaga sp. CF118 TaxID=1884367 RepID=UPI0008F3607D|nr:histidine kinase [Chitinophaga sp. CF118]SFE00757.1 Histidine kinase [Chitinophaga sp. CF118]